MEAALTAIRALHFASAIVLFGQFAYAYCVSPGRTLPARSAAVAGWSLGATVLTAIAWLAMEGANMSGLPLAQAIREGALQVVLTRTLFGHVWLVRGAAALIVALALVAMHRRDGAGHRTAQAVGAVGAAFLLVALSCAGHAAADVGTDRWAHVAADSLHLLAAGAWLGALVPLVALLREPKGTTPPAPLAQSLRAVDRFSRLGMACVGVLALSGLVNACYTVQHFSALTGSRYGRELLLKLALFAAILVLAAMNRWRIAPRMGVDGPGASQARRALVRTAIAEVVLGFAIVAIVGNLGITMPPMHGP